MKPVLGLSWANKYRVLKNIPHGRWGRYLVMHQLMEPLQEILPGLLVCRVHNYVFTYERLSGFHLNNPHNILKRSKLHWGNFLSIALLLPNIISHSLSPLPRCVRWARPETFHPLQRFRINGHLSPLSLYIIKARCLGTMLLFVSELTTLSVPKLYSNERTDDTWIGKDLIWSGRGHIEILSQHLPWGYWEKSRKI
jgi:hypothetical protein